MLITHNPIMIILDNFLERLAFANWPLYPLCYKQTKLEVSFSLTSERREGGTHFLTGGFSLDFFSFLYSVYCIQHCFICRPLESTLSEDAGIEPSAVAPSF